MKLVGYGVFGLWSALCAATVANAQFGTAASAANTMTSTKTDYTVLN